MTEQENSPTSDDVKVSEEIKTVQLLAKGLLEIYEPPLVTLKTNLRELTDKQQIVHAMLVSEKHNLIDLQSDVKLDVLLEDIACNKEKLNSISSSMVSLHKRVQNLQVRASNVEKIAKNKTNQPKPSTS